MPEPPAHVTPGAHKDLSTNPWINVNDSLIAQTAIEPPEIISIRSTGPQCRSHSQTTTGDPLYSPSVSSNHFQGVFGWHRASLDLHETRPSLKRAISRNKNSFERERRVDISEGSETTETETEVIVHQARPMILFVIPPVLLEQQIQPGDSLPGVALKYKVSLATLRSVNKLWANDTIHLRQVLYIPIQAIAKGKSKSISNSTRARPEPTFLPEFHTQRFPRSPSDWTTSSDSEAGAAMSVGNMSIIKRVPLSELSFFPPPSTSTLSSPKDTSLHTQPLSFLHSKSDNNRPLSPALGLVNFWNGAKDEIINRLSFDSARGSSDASEENDLELDVVRPRGRVRKHSADSDRGSESTSQSDGAAIMMHTMTGRGILSSSRKPQVVRTIQLQPSPKMVIPARVNISQSQTTSE